MKHFSYFIRPGYVRYDATSLPQQGVRVSAFGTPPGAVDSKAVVVLVNENAADVTLTTSIAPAGRSLTSLTPYRTTGTATFNVYPPAAAQYFNKLQCFCFSDTPLAAGAGADMAVVFYLDPALEQDPDMRRIETITLSYTFFPSRRLPPLAAAAATRAIQ
jgi:hypothetical protein